MKKFLFLVLVAFTILGFGSEDQPGFLVAFAGISGSGKSSLAKELAFLFLR